MPAKEGLSVPEILRALEMLISMLVLQENDWLVACLRWMVWLRWIYAVTRMIGLYTAIVVSNAAVVAVGRERTYKNLA